MKPIPVISRLTLLALLMMGMGFPSVVSEEDATEMKRVKSVRYLKVGLLACTRQETVTETAKPAEPKCVKTDEKADETEKPGSLCSKASGSVGTLSVRIKALLLQP